jgi:hypothetical protein
MSDIYAQFDAAFSRVSAFAILKDGELVAKVALKFPADGAGRLYAYVHWLGIEMTRGMAGGYGYDKRSAAVSDAAAKAIKAHANDERQEATDSTFHRATFFRELAAINGGDWARVLEGAGFTVIQAV